MTAILTALASLKLTLVGLALLGAASAAVYQAEHSASAWLAAPLLLLAVNLCAAVATNGVFRRQTALLVFHLALIALTLLAAAGRLTYLKGAAEVTEGAAFAGLTRRDAGPLHPGRIERVNFVNEGFEITYKPGPTRDATINRVRWIDGEGVERLGEIGDHRPLVLAGYRFYTTSNKGFAPVLLWQPNDGPPVLGALHLPSYPSNATQQATSWKPAGASAEMQVLLKFEETLIPFDRPSRFRLPGEHRLELRLGDRTWELRPGDRVSLPDGVVAYQGLRTWMGYTVFYDWTIPWVLAAAVVAVASLAWHFWRKFAARPWDN